MLEILDRHNFDRVESATSIDSLYNKVFAAEKSKDTTSEVRVRRVACCPFCSRSF